MMADWQRWKNIMKCYPFEEKRLAKWDPPYIVQPKYDGIRCRAIRIESGCLLLSSEENVIFSVPHLNVAIGDLNLDIELDGELYCHGMSFEQITSITSRTKNLHPDHTKIKFHLFDVVNEEPQFKRLAYVKSIGEMSRWIEPTPFWMCDDLDDIMRVYDKLIDLGYEGIIVRHYLNMYVRKRSTALMKFKPKKEDTYEVIGFQEEFSKDGNPKDTLGALVCRSGDGEVFNVGTGFTEERRKEIWEARGILEGQIARVKYQHVTSGKGVPRFPVFVELEVRT